MPEYSTGIARQIGRVVSISNYRVRVLLDPGVQSQVRAYPHKMAVVAQMGGYILFPVAPGESAVGIIVGASENEAIEPDEETGMTLQLVRPRRTLYLNLLGQLREGAPFSPGVSTYLEAAYPPAIVRPALVGIRRRF